jgi:DNA-binding GntR family transcriptional regulator
VGHPVKSVLARIRHKILAGAYRPGAPLVQGDLAAELGVEREPVRAALADLRGEGLIDNHARRGFKVRVVSPGEIDEVFRLRLLVEPASIAEGARLARAEDHIAAREALRAVNAAVAQKDCGEIPALNSAFHLALVLPRRQPVAFEVLGRLHVLSQQCVSMHLLSCRHFERASHEHRQMFEAWAAGEADAVEAATRAHIAETQSELNQFIERDRA